MSNSQVHLAFLGNPLHSLKGNGHWWAISDSGFGGKFGLVCHLDFVTRVASQGLMTCLQMGCYLLQSCRIKLIVF